MIMPETERDQTIQAADRSADKNVDGPAMNNLDASIEATTDVQQSDLKLIVLASAFFAIWASNVKACSGYLRLPIVFGYWESGRVDICWRWPTFADVQASAILMASFVLPVIAKDFGVSGSQVQWVLATNNIVGGSLQIIAGRCCDMFGRKRAFHLSMILLIVPTILSAFMPNLAALNVCRGIAGIGGAIVQPAAAGMIGTMYPAGRKRTLAFVAVTCGGVSGGSAGMLIAGAFLEYNRWTWRPCYLLIGLVYVWPWTIVTWLVPSDPPHTKRSKLDWLGSLLLGIFLFLLLFGFTSSQTESRGWKTPYVPVLIAVSAIFGGLFVLRQIQLTRAMGSGNKPAPLIPRVLLSAECWDLFIIYISAACAWGSTDTFWTLISYLYLDVLKLNALQAGLRLSVVFFSGLVAAAAVALAINKIAPRALIGFFCTISIASFILLALRHVDWPYWKADLWALLFVAYNTDVLVAAGSTLVSMTAPIKDGSVALAIFSTSIRIGSAIGLAVAILMRTNIGVNALQHGLAPDEALLQGLRAAFWFCAGLAAVAAIIILLGMRGWQKLSDMKQGTDFSIEALELPVVSGPRRDREAGV